MAPAVAMPAVHELVRAFDALDNDMMIQKRARKHEHDYDEHQQIVKPGSAAVETERDTLVEIFRAAYKEVTGASELFPRRRGANWLMERVLRRGAFCFVHRPLPPQCRIADRPPRLALYLQLDSPTATMLSHHDL